jgi:hypothetical protein
MNLKVHHAVAAAIASSAAFTGVAHAVDITTVPAGNVLYAGGSTAVSASLTEYFFQSTDATSQPCDETQSIDYYTDTSGATQFQAVACTANSSMGLPANTLIAFVKELNGGSFNGLGPVGANTTLTFPITTQLTSNAFQTGSTACTSASVAALVKAGTTLAVGYTKHTCSSTANFSSDTAAYSTTGLAPNIGFADVNSSAFGTTDAALGITTGQTIQIIFAPAVSLGLYHALQAAEGLPQDDLVSDMPGLSKSELTSLFTNQVNRWSSMMASNGTLLTAEPVIFGSSSGSTYGGGATTTPSSNIVYFCRRDDYSGTERADEIYYGLQNCVPSGSVNGFRASSSFTDSSGHANNQTFGNSWVSSDTSVATFPASSTGNVLACLQGHDSVGHFAIGYASIDNAWGAQQGTSSRRDWRFIKVNDHVPSVENAAAGKWQVIAQSVYALPSNNAQGNYPTGTALTFAQFFTGTGGNNATSFGKAATVAAVNAQDQWTAPALDGGLLSIPLAGVNTPNAASAALSTFQLNPVSDFAKVSGATLNNCQNPERSGAATSIGIDAGVAWATP